MSFISRYTGTLWVKCTHKRVLTFIQSVSFMPTALGLNKHTLWLYILLTRTVTRPRHSTQQVPSRTRNTTFSQHVSKKIKEKLEALYERKSISKLQIVIEKRRMWIMTYKQYLFFNIISKQIKNLLYRFTSPRKPAP